MKLLIAALLAVFSTGAMAEWTYLASAKNGAFDIYIDKTTIRKRGNVAKMWKLQDHKPRKGSGALSNTSLDEYDCVEIRSKPLDFISYSDNMGKGEIVSISRHDPTINYFDLTGDVEGWMNVPPDSPAMRAWKAACKK